MFDINTKINYIYVCLTYHGLQDLDDCFSKSFMDLPFVKIRTDTPVDVKPIISSMLPLPLCH